MVELAGDALAHPSGMLTMSIKPNRVADLTRGGETKIDSVLVPEAEDALENLLIRALAIVRSRKQPSGRRRLRIGDNGLRSQEGPASRAADAEQAHGVFAKRGDVWFVAYEGRELLLNDMIGFRYLAELLAYPHRETSALDLFLATHGTLCDAASRKAVLTSACDLGPALDRRAVAAYRSRLRELDDDVREARRDHDLARVERAQAERTAILAELKAALGLHGASIPRGSPARRAQSSVARAIKRAKSRIARRDALLGRHLDATIHTGTSCSYTPDPRLVFSWKTR